MCFRRCFIEALFCSMPKIFRIQFSDFQLEKYIRSAKAAIFQNECWMLVAEYSPLTPTTAKEV